MKFCKNDDDLLKKTEQIYGETQLDICIEELSELIKEITKARRGKNNRNHLIEELGDVTIITRHLQLIYNISENELDEAIRFKLERLTEIIKEKEKDIYFNEDNVIFPKW